MNNEFVTFLEETRNVVFAGRDPGHAPKGAISPTEHRRQSHLNRIDKILEKEAEDERRKEINRKMAESFKRSSELRRSIDPTSRMNDLIVGSRIAEHAKKGDQVDVPRPVKKVSKGKSVDSTKVEMFVDFLKAVEHINPELIKVIKNTFMSMEFSE